MVTFEKTFTKNLLFDRINHEYLFYCSNLVFNSRFLISNPQSIIITFSTSIGKFLILCTTTVGKQLAWLKWDLEIPQDISLVSYTNSKVSSYLMESSYFLICTSEFGPKLRHIVTCTKFHCIISKQAPNFIVILFWKTIISNGKTWNKLNFVFWNFILYPFHLFPLLFLVPPCLVVAAIKWNPI